MFSTTVYKLRKQIHISALASLAYVSMGFQNPMGLSIKKAG